MSIKSFVQILILVLITLIIISVYYKYFNTNNKIVEEINSPNINNHKTISIKSIIDNEVMPKDILGTLDANINNYLNILNSDDISELIELYKNNCWKMRDRVRFLQNNIEFEGILDDITDTFEILIKVNGELKKFNSGELSFSY